MQPWKASQLHYNLPQVLWDQNGVLRRELEALRLRLQQESRAERGLPAAGETQEGLLQLCLDKSEVSRWWDFHRSVVYGRYVVYVI